MAREIKLKDIIKPREEEQDLFKKFSEWIEKNKPQWKSELKIFQIDKLWEKFKANGGE